MLQALGKDFWWPSMREFVTCYVKGCTICQSTKPNTVQLKTLIYPITTDKGSAPFETIAMDLITDLPKSKGYNAILTIVNHDCTKAALFLPCTKEITSKGIAQLYAQYIFPHYGTPKQIISD